jgi:hypothetical protein
VSANAKLPPFPDAAWRGVFADYRTLIEDISECPLPFHFAALSSVIAAEFGDRARLLEGTNTFPHCYIFICGSTGTKKGTASRLVRDHVLIHMPAKEHWTLTSISSAEGLIRSLVQNRNVRLYYDEVADLFAVAGRSGQRIEPTLNSAYDQEPLQANVKKMSESLNATDYCFNLIVNGTPDHVRLELTEKFYSGGLLNRFIVFASDPTGRAIPIMRIPGAQQSSLIAAKIVSTVAAWYNLKAGRGGIRVGFTDEAVEMHSAWYIAHTKAMQEAPEAISKPLTRVDSHVKKQAMMYCLLESVPCRDPRITGDQMAAALAVVEYNIASMLWMTRNWSGAKSTNQQSVQLIEDRIRAHLKEHGCMPERSIYRALSLSSEACGRATDALAKGGELHIIDGRPRAVHLKPCKCFGEQG